MKKLFFPVIAICIVLITSSCKKTTTSGPVTKTETPAKATIAAKLVVDTFGVNNNSTFEFGNKLYFSKNGSVTKLGCKMASKGNFRVSFWDYTTQNLIAATTINVTDTTQFIYNSVSPIAVTANTRYVLSINNTISTVKMPYYVFYKYPGSATIYPFTTGSVTYENIQSKISATSAFPDMLNPGDQVIFGGVPDMQFEYTE